MNVQPASSVRHIQECLELTNTLLTAGETPQLQLMMTFISSYL